MDVPLLEAVGLPNHIERGVNRAGEDVAGIEVDNVLLHRLDDAIRDLFANLLPFLASAVGYALDGFDLLLLGFILRAISSDFVA